jgi:hypothetical protein
LVDLRDQRSAAYNHYADLRRDEWATKILPKLKAMPMRELMERSGLSRATLQAIRAGRRPHPTNRAKLIADLKNLNRSAKQT